MVDVLGCLTDNVRVHLYGLPWPAGAPAAGCHQDPEGAIIRLAATWKVGFRVQGLTPDEDRAACNGTSARGLVGNLLIQVL